MSRKNQMLSATLALAVSVSVGGAATSAFAAKSADAARLAPIAVQHNKIAPVNGQQLYVVQIKGSSVSTSPGTMAQKGKRLDVHSEAAQQHAGALRSRQDLIMASVGAKPVYNYVYGMNGFAARMTPEQVSALKRNPDVLTIWKNEIRQPQTDKSGFFIGLQNDEWGGGMWDDGIFGEDIVVGIIDTGIWPENPSFSPLSCTDGGSDPVDDPINQSYDCADPVDVYGEPPETWNQELNAEGTCDFGNGAFNPDDVPFECNGKLLAARQYRASFPEGSLLPTEFESARDVDGHGSHTGSTAAGNGNVPASVGGAAEVNLHGVAPRARISVYKVCWNGDDGGCGSADSAAAVEQAFADGVDVLNFSIGGSSTSFTGADDMAFLFARQAGIFVATSNGNSGPGSGTTGTPAGVPWVTSVGAGNDDGVVAASVWMTLPQLGPSPVAFEAIEGGGPVPVSDLGFFTSNLAIPEDPDNFTGCAPWTNEAAGRTALVSRGTCGFADKYDNAAAAGAPAILVFNDRGGLLVMGGTETTTIPGMMIRQAPGAGAYANVAGGFPISQSFDPLAPGVSQEKIVAGFSSRGPNGGMPDIIKPDVTAPGVDIGAAYAPGVQWVNLNGTSMASPHVAGMAALMRQAHPSTTGGWDPSYSHSALVTTGSIGNQNDDDNGDGTGGSKATPFDQGGGFIRSGNRPNGNSRYPGVVYGNTLQDQQAALCGETNQAGIIDPAYCATLVANGVSIDPSDLNYPSIGIAELVGQQTVQRTAVCTGPGKDTERTFNVRVKEPAGIDVEVTPSSFTCKKRDSVDFTVTFTAREDAVLGEWAFGNLKWESANGAIARSPLAIRPVAFSAPAGAAGTGADGSLDIPVKFGYDGGYMVTMNGLVAGVESDNVIEDGAVNQSDAFVVPEGTLRATFTMSDEDVGAGDGSDDLDIQLYGPDTAGFPFRGQSQGGSSEERIELSDPEPGLYIVVVFDFASAAGPTAYSLFNYNQDGTDAGNSVLTAPAAAVAGTEDNVTVDWAGLAEGMKYLGDIDHTDGVEFLAETEVIIDTR